MGNDLMTEVSIAIRCSVLIVSNRSLLKYLASTTYVMLFAVIFMTQPITAQARDLPDMNSSPEQVMSKMKERLNLTEEQETKVRPIIEESIQKRREILKKDPQDRSTIKNELQELQWTTDMRLGVILTEEQMKEYQKLREEQSEKMRSEQRSRGSRSGRSEDFNK